MVFKPTFGISNLFTRILPGTIALAAITVTELFIKAARSGGDPKETTFSFDMLFSLDSLTVILLVALLLGELIHLFSENISPAPSYFRIILYNKEKNRSILTVLQRRKIMKREASAAKDTTGVTLVQKIWFFFNKIFKNHLYLEILSVVVLLIVLYPFILIKLIVQYVWNLLCPNWLFPDQGLNDITEDDLTKIFDLLKEKNKDLADITHPNRLYMALLYEAKDLESERTKELRVRYQAFRNSKLTIYMSLIIIPFSILYTGIVSDNLALASFFSVVVLILVPPTVTLIHQIGIITNVEQQYVQSLMIEYLIENGGDNN